MADCSKTVEFLREWGRMCRSNQKCNDCDAFLPLEGICRLNVRKCHTELFEAAARIVQKWSDEHPVMTWAGKLRELLPGADIETLTRDCCPAAFFKGAPRPRPNRATCLKSISDGCTYCWNREYKEE